MKAYWDTSALVEAIIATPAAVATFDTEHERITRAHTLAETFSQLTKGTLKNAEGETIALLADDAAEDHRGLGWPDESGFIGWKAGCRRTSARSKERHPWRRCA